MTSGLESRVRAARRARPRGLARTVLLVLAATAAAACGADPPEAGEGPDAAPTGDVGQRPAAPPADAPAGDAGPPAPPTGGSEPGDPAEPDEEPGVDGVRGAPWTAGIVDERQGRVAGAATLVRVESARHPGFDRLVFEFEGGVPGYHLEYVDRPVRQCGSGEAVRLAGDGWLAIRFEPARAHTEQGRATIEERERRPGLPVVKELVITCDFEAQVEWVAGVSSPNRYRAFVLAAPARLVVDIRH